MSARRFAHRRMDTVALMKSLGASQRFVISAASVQLVLLGVFGVVVGSIVGFDGAIEFDKSKPDGTPRKLLDTARLSELGWQPSISLEKGIRETYAWYLEQT